MRLFLNSRGYLGCRDLVTWISSSITVLTTCQALFKVLYLCNTPSPRVSWSSDVKIMGRIFFYHLISQKGNWGTEMLTLPQHIVGTKDLKTRLLVPELLTQICPGQTCCHTVSPGAQSLGGSLAHLLHPGTYVTSRCRMPWGPHRETQTSVQDARLAWWVSYTDSTCARNQDLAWNPPPPHPKTLTTQVFFFFFLWCQLCLFLVCKITHWSLWTHWDRWCAWPWSDVWVVLIENSTSICERNGVTFGEPGLWERRWHWEVLGACLRGPLFTLAGTSGHNRELLSSVLNKAVLSSDVSKQIPEVRNRDWHWG